jgi:antirestriction protein ArdC
MPEATHVAGFHTWRKLGRFVKKGEHGIAILAPMVTRNHRAHETPELGSDDERRLVGFKVAYVFDVAQTDGEPLPDLSGAEGEPGEWLAHLESLIREAGIELNYDHLPGTAEGCAMPGKVFVRAGLPSNETFAILAHEYAHVLLHQKTEGSRPTHRVRETEAEAVAYAVCRACGIDSTLRSADYIQLHRGSTLTLQESLMSVQSAAAEIIAGLHARRGNEAACTMALSA